MLGSNEVCSADHFQIAWSLKLLEHPQHAMLQQVPAQIGDWDAASSI